MEKTYILRDIDPVLWAEVKACAKRDGLTLRMVTLALLKGYAQGQVGVVGAALAPR